MDKFKSMIDLRSEGIPMAYLIGKKGILVYGFYYQ